MLDKPIWISLGINGSGLAAQEAWWNIESYRTMASIQLHRIGENNYYDAAIEANEAALQGSLGLSKVEMLGVQEVRSIRSTCDAHFYLNCWRIVALNAFRIANAVEDQRLSDFLVEQQCPLNTRGNSLWFGGGIESFTLGWYAQGRDHFEHIDERIFGGSKHHETMVDSSKVHSVDPSITMPTDARYFPSPFFNGKYMVVGKSKWEISPQAHTVLTEATNQIYEIGLMIAEEKGAVDHE